MENNSSNKNDDTEHDIKKVKADEVSQTVLNTNKNDEIKSDTRNLKTDEVSLGEPNSMEYNSSDKNDENDSDIKNAKTDKVSLDEPNSMEHNSRSNNDENEPDIKKVKTDEVELTVPSKRQLKRLMKKEKWLANLPAKRAKEKARLKEKRKKARENNIKLGPSRRELKSSNMSSSNCKVTVALDFSFDHLMSPKDISKCINQVLRCYSYNRRAVDPMQFYIVNFKDKAKAEMDKHNGYNNWDVHFRTESYLEVFDKDRLVYLTSDSDNVIEELEDDKVYIIGALVDHNSHKGLCYNKAVADGIQHGQLPLGKHFDMKTRKVLAINHVFEIMLLVCNKQSWREAMMEVLPQRKGAIEREEESEETDCEVTEKLSNDINII